MVVSLECVAHWMKRTKDQIADRVAWPEGSASDEDDSAEERHPAQDDPVSESTEPERAEPKPRD